jgi:hypothetical protein
MKTSVHELAAAHPSRIALLLAIFLSVMIMLSASCPAGGLDRKYLESAKSEPELSEKDVMAAINRWTGEIYGGSDAAALAYTWACLIDPATADIAAEWRKATAGCPTVEEKVAAIDAWNNENMCHTQMLEDFADKPGKDPWGSTLEGTPTFRKLLPSEMKAMERLTGRISGKCMTLANLLLAAFVHMDIDPDDIAIVHVQMPNFQHGAAMFMWDGEMVRTNNHRIGMFYGPGAPPAFPPAPMPVIALYNNRFYSPGGFSAPAGCMNKGAFDGDGTLMEKIVEKCCGGAEIPQAGKKANFDFSDPGKLRRELLGGKGAGDETAALAKYAYQSLYVKHPEYYLKASLREPHVRELAAGLDGIDAIIRWVRENTEAESIFPDAAERIMTADQVIVFGTGGPADRAVLLWTLLKHKGIDSEIIITEDNAYVCAGGACCAMDAVRVTQMIGEPVITVSLE